MSSVVHVPCVYVYLGFDSGVARDGVKTLVDMSSPHNENKPSQGHLQVNIMTVN